MELEENELLKHDLGPFQATKEDWGAYTIEIPKYQAKIMCIGSLQNIRGLKYRNQRPDLIICDDMEDVTSFQEEDKIELLHEWFMSEIWSIGDETTNIVVLGNLLHPASIMLKLCVAIRKGEMPGIFRAYPLLDDCNRILWTAKYPDLKSIKDIENSLPKPVYLRDLYSAFQREYLLDMSHVRIDDEMDKKHSMPISNTASKQEDFEISVPMWSIGVIVFGDKPNTFGISTHYRDGYPWESIPNTYFIGDDKKTTLNGNNYDEIIVNEDRPNRWWQSKK
jgi:hypothetical protein